MVDDIVRTRFLICIQQLEGARDGGAEKTEEVGSARNVGVQFAAVLAIAGGHEALLFLTIIYEVSL